MVHGSLKISEIVNSAFRRYYPQFTAAAPVDFAHLQAILQYFNTAA